MSKTFLFQPIQFSMIIIFVYTQLNVKTVLFQIIQFSVNTVSMSKTVLFQTIEFSIQKQYYFKQFSLAYVRSLNVKIVLFQAVQFSVNPQFSSIWPKDRTLSGGPGSNGNERLLCIPQSSSITGTSPSDCLVSYPGCLWEGVLPLCRDAVSVFYSPSQLDKSNLCI